jgi:hypothetical protein
MAAAVPLLAARTAGLGSALPPACSAHGGGQMRREGAFDCSAFAGCEDQHVHARTLTLVCPRR